MGTRRDACALCRADVTQIARRDDGTGNMVSATRVCDACGERMSDGDLLVSLHRIAVVDSYFGIRHLAGR